MSVKVAINGFGRIGRLAFKQMFGQEGIEIVAINDLSGPSQLAYLLKYDSTQERFVQLGHENEVTGDDENSTLSVYGKTVKIFKERDAVNIPWGELGVDVVLECTGFYTSKEKSEVHLQAGARKVVISAPAGNDLKTIVYNVNHETLTSDDHIISAASCTTNCLAPMAKALNDFAPIESGIMKTIHAYTGDQQLLDSSQKNGNLRRSRAAALNIVPSSSGAAKAIGLVIPELNGKMTGSALRVPTPTGSITMLYAVVDKEVTRDEINAAMKAAADESFGYTEEHLVSKDIVGMSFGSLFDATQTLCIPMGNGKTQVEVAAWYDNEYSYTAQMVRTIKYLASL
ncbi:MAG: type I glyceraldehyde-3-phosphate dehydrogenase [Clostridiales bacterium]|nr:type I glyceraldehyde-3-phosphate dehydrogenase [Clostridiales bacterium]MBS5877708.1 type I glyceraldehyde-3-phosphate dehydrogenase [Clostridiales bacterium]MDU3490022.1 type I glyceraldehyde-3-phosphate dehydrogenase [Clostridiales bacterium]